LTPLVKAACALAHAASDDRGGTLQFDLARLSAKSAVPGSVRLS